MQEEYDAKPAVAPAHRGGTRKRLFVGILSTIVVGAAIVGGAAYLDHRHSHKLPVSPVPKAISQSVNFPIYYPIQTKLPAGYTLDVNSFKRPVQNGVSYTVSYSGGKKLVFSLQPKPSDSELQSFTASYIPLHNSYQTPIGQALLGAYNTKAGTETLVSLPTHSSTWIIVTAPYDINQNQLKQILSSLGRGSS